MIDMLSTMTGNSRDKIAQDVERDYFMDSAEAKEYGIVDKVLDKR